MPKLIHHHTQSLQVLNVFLMIIILFFFRLGFGWMLRNIQGSHLFNWMIHFPFLFPDTRPFISHRWAHSWTTLLKFREPFILLKIRLKLFALYPENLHVPSFPDNCKHRQVSCHCFTNFEKNNIGFNKKPFPQAFSHTKRVVLS